MKETKYLDLFGATNKQENTTKNHSKTTVVKDINCEEYCVCSSQNEWVPFFTALIWPIIFIIFTLIFYKKVKVIMDEIGLLIGRIKKFKVVGLNFMRAMKISLSMNY